MTHAHTARDAAGPATAYAGFTVANAFAAPADSATEDIAESTDEFDNRFAIRVVKESSWRTRTSSLIERRYAWRGYSASLPEYDSSGRLTLSATVRDTTVATISAGLDSPDGMYVGALFPDVVDQLRAEGRKLCEFTKLAVDASVRSKAVLGAIFHVANMYVFNLHRCTDVLVEVNPRHVRFYQGMLGFMQVAGVRVDPVVNAPAVLLRLDLSYSAQEIARLGGRRRVEARERSFYPFFFAAEEEARIVGRLRCH